MECEKNYLNCKAKATAMCSNMEVYDCVGLLETLHNMQSATGAQNQPTNVCSILRHSHHNRYLQ
jgi:hypothetical protein